MTQALKLSPPQQEPVQYRGSHLQAIVCAGSGKTESGSQRIAGLIKKGATPESVVAFTFTERAADADTSEWRPRKIVPKPPGTVYPPIELKVARVDEFHLIAEFFEFLRGR